MFIEKIEIAPSNRSSCKDCRHFIKAGSKRGVANGVSFGHIQHSYFCTKCTEQRLRQQAEMTQKLFNLLQEKIMV